LNKTTVNKLVIL